MTSAVNKRFLAIGMDVGSTTVKATVVDPESKAILWSDYQRHHTKQPEKVLEVEWAPTGQSTFLVNIQVEALDRARLLADITMVLSDAHVNILSANLSTTRNRVAKSRFTFEMAEAKHLDNVLKAVRSVPGVFDAYRVTQ